MAKAKNTPSMNTKTIGANNNAGNGTRPIVTEVINSFEKGTVHKTVFGNGATFLHHRYKGMSGATLYVWFLGGSRIETEKTQGMAHLVEHMIFKGENENGDKNNLITHRLESLGADINAFTSKEYMQFELGCLSKRLPTIFPLFVDMILNPPFPEGELEKEKNVVIQELKEDLDDNEMVAEEKFFEKAFSFPLGHSIGGSIRSVKSFTRKELFKFYKKFFGPERMVVSIVSDDDYKFYIGALEEIFENLNLNSEKEPLRPKLGKGQKKIQKFKSTLSLPCEVSSFIMSSVGFAMGEENKGPWVLLDHHLSDGLSSRLFMALREEEGLCYGLSSATTSFTDIGCFEISLSCDYKNIPKIRKIIVNIFTDIAQNGITPEQLDKAKRMVADYWEIIFDDVDERNTHLGSGELFHGKIYSIESLVKMIEEVTIEDIQKVCRKILKFGFSEIIVKPKVKK